MSFVIKQFEIGPMQNFGYMIGDLATKSAFVVDPAWEPHTFFNKVKQEGYDLKGVVVSHAHYDHTNAIEAVLQQVDVPVYANEKEITYSQSGTSIVASLGKTVKPVEGGTSVQLGETKVKFLFTPGHTPGSQCIQVGNHLITGDTLFIGGCGRADLPGGEATTLFKSLQKIAGLPSDTVIWPGHDYGSVKTRELKEEISQNPYLQMRDQQEFIQTVSSS